MSSNKPSKSDRAQIMTAVLFMGVFAAIFLVIVLPKNNFRNALCNLPRANERWASLCPDLPSPTPLGSASHIASRVTSACLNNEGLKLSVAFDEPLTGSSTIQVFTTGDDYFPSEQGISDSFKMSMTIPNEADHLDITIPVDSMPVGEQIFGNILINDEGISSFVAYSVNVSDCSITKLLSPQLTSNDIPMIHSATCLPSKQLMIAFKFEDSVLGQYRALVDNKPYQLASVINQPATLFFSGDPPPEGPVVIRLISATDEVTVFEETYTPPACGST